MSNTYFSRSSLDVNPQVATLIEALHDELEHVVASTIDLPEREREARAAAFGADVAAEVLTLILELTCQRASLAEIAKQGLSVSDVRWRREREYYAKISTTVGEISVWTWAYRHRNASGGWTTKVPARGTVVPARRVRSSNRALEWTCLTAAHHPYRKATRLLHRFTNGRLKKEDNTINRHAVAIGSIMKRHWKYLSPAEIGRVLRDKATRDKATGRPLLYWSCDAHSLPQYEGDTWAAPWKNVNGIRLWCQDRTSGAIIHLGCDFTVGDCAEVERIIREIMSLGILPSDLCYRIPESETAPATEVRAQLVVITDGAKWLNSRLKPVLPKALWLLDAYHVFEYLSEFAAAQHGPKSAEAKKLYRELVEHLMGRKPRQRRRSNQPRSFRRKKPKTRAPSDYQERLDAGYGPARLISALKKLSYAGAKFVRHRAFVERLEKLQDRMAYLEARVRGIQIGSGAMESIHRTASQQRLKLPGARWRPEAAQALLNLRCLELAGRWDEFWSHSGLDDVLRMALGGGHVRRDEAA